MYPGRPGAVAREDIPRVPLVQLWLARLAAVTCTLSLAGSAGEVGIGKGAIERTNSFS